MDSGRATHEGRLTRRGPESWLHFETRDLLLLCFLATFLVIARAALRWHLHLPGHSMLPAALLLVLARACVPRGAAATLVGGAAGLVAAALGLGGRAGPFLVLKLALGGAAVDAGSALRPTRPLGWAAGAVLGAACGATDFVPVALVEALAGLPWNVVLAHAAVSAGAKAAFGAVGGAAAGAIAARLRHHGVLEAA
jgi:hypothetical protein